MNFCVKRLLSFIIVALLLLECVPLSLAETESGNVIPEAESVFVDPVVEETETSLEEALGLTSDNSNELSITDTDLSVIDVDTGASIPEPSVYGAADTSTFEPVVYMAADTSTFEPVVYMAADTSTFAPIVYDAADTSTFETTDGNEANNPIEPDDNPKPEEFEMPDPIEGYENFPVSGLISLGSETLKNVNLVRVGGYEGHLAKITGKLKLYNVLIDGVPATQTDLAQHFELVTGSTIILSSTSKLLPSFNAISIDKGTQKTIKIKWSGKTVKGETAKWRTSNKKVVTVSKSGIIKGISKGVATISATYKKKTVYVRVVVTNPVTSVAISPSVKYINEQTQQQFTAVAYPANADYPALTWYSNNTQVAQVSQDGLVSCIAPGKATIYAYPVNGRGTAMPIQVIRPAEDMTLPETVQVNYGKTKVLTPSFVPQDTSLKTCTWTTSNKAVATVSKYGVVTGKGVGSCVITATSHNGIVRQCTVNVINPVKSIKMSYSNLTLAQNYVYKMNVKFSPSNPSFKDLTWSSSNPAVVSVDENGTIIGLKTGKATIKAVAHNGKSAKCTVTVKFVKPTSLNFSQLFVTMNPGNTFQSKPAITPNYASDQRVIYSSSNPSVATVDENGLVTAVGTGSATISGKCAANSKAVNTFEVCVIKPGSGRMTGLTIGINPGHQTKTITKKYPIAPGSKEKGYGCKVGAVGKWTRIPEYTTVLAIGQKLARMLAEEGATVVITRTSNNVSLTNIQRTQILNNAGVDIALHLHCNSSTSSSKNGISTFYRSKGSWVAESKTIAKVLAKSMSSATGLKNKGAEAYNGYMSLNYSTTPAVLLEMGYLSNKTEDRLLATDAFREKMAKGIFEGLCSYFGR